jgi:gamma-glutamyltranspeptidase / glutathione hydrolase
MHLNNMLGEQDLNPLGFHQHSPGARVPSMMAPTVVLSEGRPEIAIGSAGSNRIRSAILQTVLGVVDHGLRAQEAVSAPRIHVEGREADAEPGVDEAALERLEESGWTVRRWSEQNLFFGGAQAVARNPDTGRLTGGGDPRRGGVATVVD